MALQITIPNRHTPPQFTAQRSQIWCGTEGGRGNIWFIWKGPRVNRSCGTAAKFPGAQLVDVCGTPHPSTGATRGRQRGTEPKNMRGNQKDIKAKRCQYGRKWLWNFVGKKVFGGKYSVGNFGEIFWANAIFDLLARPVFDKYSIYWVFVCLSLSFCKYSSWSLPSPDDKLSENIWFIWSRTSYVYTVEINRDVTMRTDKWTNKWI